MTDTESQGWSYVEASFPPDRMVSALGNGVKEGQRLPRKTRAPHPVGLTLTHISLEQLRSSYSSSIWQLAGVEQENGDAGRCALLGHDTVRVG